MAKRYRYAFAREKESEDGVFSSVLAGVSVLLFVTAIVISQIFKGAGVSGVIVGGLCLCAMLISIYGFIQGLRSFRVPNRNHTFSKLGAIANGMIMIGWLGLYLMGV